MKVLVVSEPGVDGVFRHVERLCYFLMDRGHQVRLAYSSRRSSDRLSQLVAELERRGFPTLDLRVQNAPRPGDVSALFALWRFLREHGADVIHGHSSKAGFLSRALSIIGVSQPLLYTPHAYYRMNDPHNAKARFFHACERLLGKIGATVNIGESEAQFARMHLGIRPERQHLIRNGVDCAFFAPASSEEKRSLRKQFGIPPDATVLGSVGRCSAQKDPLTMYRAVHAAHNRRPELYFFHVGQGELAGEVDAFAASHDMAGWSKRVPYLSQPASFYKTLDGFILSSLYEGMSYATLEAIATGLPLVLTRTPGNEDFARFGLSHAFFGEAGDGQSLSESIENWLNALGKPANHRQVACERFDESICFAELLEIYQTHLAR